MRIETDTGREFVSKDAARQNEATMAGCVWMISFRVQEAAKPRGGGRNDRYHEVE